MSRLARTLLTILATLGLALLLPIGTTMAADCSLTASPRTGAPGTEFVFKGKGFTPTTLTLTRGDETPQVVDVSGGSSTAFRFSLIAGDADVGKWHAVAEGCSDTVSIRVTLPPTTTSSAAAEAATTDDTTELAGMTLLGVLFLGATALLLPRLTRAARSR
jgi:hypothetical protein